MDLDIQGCHIPRVLWRSPGTAGCNDFALGDISQDVRSALMWTVGAVLRVMLFIAPCCTCRGKIQSSWCLDTGLRGR